MGKYKTLAENTLYISIGTLGSKLIGFFMLPLYTRWLNVSDYGTVDAMTVYSTLIMGLLSMCIAESIFVFPKNKEENIQSQYYSSGFLFCIIQILFGFIIFGVFKLVAYLINWNGVFSQYIWYIFFLTISAVIQAYCQSFARSLDKMFHYSMTGMVSTFSIALFSFMLIPSFGLRGFASAYIIANLNAFLYSFVSTKQYKFLDLRNANMKVLKEMIRYSIPMMPNNVMWWMISGFSRPVIEIYLNTFSLGIYAVANKVSSMLHSLFSIFGMSWFNSALDEYGKPDFEKFYNNCLKLIFTFLIFCSLIFVMVSEWVVKLLTTHDYYDAYKYIPFFLLSVISSAISGVVGCIFACEKKSNYYFYSSMWGGISSVISMLLLTPLYGLTGVALSVLISHFFILFSRIVYSNSFVTIKNYMYYVILIIIYIGFTINLFYGRDYKYQIYVVLWIVTFLASKKELTMLIYQLKDRLS